MTKEPRKPRRLERLLVVRETAAIDRTKKHPERLDGGGPPRVAMAGCRAFSRHLIRIGGMT